MERGRKQCMSITIKSTNDDRIEIGYFGFYRLRRKIAELASLDIYNAYSMVPDIKSEAEKKDYNQYLNRLEKKYSDDSRSLVLEFLYASDCDGAMDAEHCKAVYDLIKDCDDKTQYGYVDCAMWDIPATIASFAELLKEAADSGEGIEWY